MDEPNHATVGVAFATDDALVDAIRRLTDDGFTPAWRIGATDRDRAARVALAVGAAADLDPLDPFKGVAGVASGADAADGVNRGALYGGVAGAIAGLAAGQTEIGALMPVDAPLRSIAASLLFFAVGVAAGGVLGGAFGKRPSTHAGFRLIDAIEAGAVAADGPVDAARIDDARRVLGEAGAAEVVVVAS